MSKNVTSSPEEAHDIRKMILNGIIAGQNLKQITEYLQGKGIKTTDKLLLSYYTEAREAIAERVKIDSDIEFGLAMERFNLLFMNALKIQDFKTALSIESKRIDLIKLLESRKPAAAENISFEEMEDDFNYEG